MASCLIPLRRVVGDTFITKNVSLELLGELNKLACCVSDVYKSFVSEYVDRALRLIAAVGGAEKCGGVGSLAELLSNLQSIIVDLASVVRGEYGVQVPDEVYRGLRTALRALYDEQCEGLIRGVVESMDGLRTLLKVLCGRAFSA